MCKAFLTFTAALALASGLGTSARAQGIDPAASELVFVTRQMGVPVEGRFQRWSAQVALDPRKPEAGQVVLRIQMDRGLRGARGDRRGATRGVARHGALSASGVPLQRHPPGRRRPLRDGGPSDAEGRVARHGGTGDVDAGRRPWRGGGNFVVKRSDYRIGEGQWTDASLVAHR